MVLNWICPNAVALMGLAVASLPSSNSPVDPFVVQDAFVDVDIPAYLRLRQGVGAIRKGHQSGVLSLDGMNKLVTITWTASAVCNLAPDYSLVWDPAAHTLGTHKVRTMRQEVSRRYFPTAACMVDSSTILVAGVLPSGKVLVDKIELVWPTPMPAVMTDVITGISSVHPVSPGLGRETRLYESDLTTGGVVRCLSRVRRVSGSPSQGLLMFDESCDVYTIGLADGALSLLASSSNSTAGLGLVSLLSGKDQTSIAARDHKVNGYTYTFVRDLGLAPATPGGGGPITLILVDSDRDGAIEAYLELSAGDVLSQGWNQLDSYEEWWLN